MARTHYLVSVLNAYPKSQISQVFVIKEYLQLSIKIHWELSNLYFGAHSSHYQDPSF